jgi:hypothetical protein
MATLANPLCLGRKEVEIDVQDVAGSPDDSGDEVSVEIAFEAQPEDDLEYILWLCRPCSMDKTLVGSNIGSVAI